MFQEARRERVCARVEPALGRGGQISGQSGSAAEAPLPRPNSHPMQDPAGPSGGPVLISGPTLDRQQLSGSLGEAPGEGICMTNGFPGRLLGPGSWCSCACVSACVCLRTAGLTTLGVGSQRPPASGCTARPSSQASCSQRQPHLGHRAGA